MRFSFVELTREQSLDAVDLGGDVTRGEPGEFSDGGGVEAFEPGEDDLSIERLQALDELSQAVEGEATVGVRGVDNGRNIVKAEEGVGAGAALVGDPGDGGVVGDTIGPGTESTLGLVAGEAAPESEVNLLEEFAALIRVSFIAAGETGEGGSVVGCGLIVIGVLLAHN
jgi:hypothetical protein